MGVSLAKLIIYNIVLLFICHNKRSSSFSSTTTDGDGPYITTILAQDPLMCHYDVVAKDTLPEVVSTYSSAFVCNTHDSDQPGEHWVAMYVDELGDYFDPYGQKPQHIPSSQTL